MTRRQKRFERRRACRAVKRDLFIKRYDNFNNVCNRTNLFEAADKSKRLVMWKASVQNWSIHQLLNTERLYRDLKAGKDVRKGFSHFVIFERGKRRNISAVRFYERIVQKTLCEKVLYPAYTRSLLFDNGASQQGKGVKFSQDRLIKKLRQHFKRFGKDGYILLIDFKGYFENIDHGVLKDIYRRIFKDKRLLRLIDGFVDAYGEKGLGLGSETSQMHAIAFPNVIDHAVTENIQGIKFGRYMDDSFVISKDKATLYRVLDLIKDICGRLKIILSPKKTKIVSLKNCFIYLKTIFHFTDTGKIIKKPCRKNVTRQRRKVKKQIRLIKSGRLGLPEFQKSFESWASSMLRRNARLVVWNIRRLIKRKEIKLCHTKQKRKLTAALTLVNRNCSNMITPRAKWCLNLQQN